MKRILAGIGFIALTLMIAALWPETRPINASFVQSGSTGVDPGQARIVINLPARNQTFWCDSSPAYKKLCQTMFDMNALNNTSVDVVMINNNVFLYDTKGRQVFPRP